MKHFIILLLIIGNSIVKAQNNTNSTMANIDSYLEDSDLARRNSVTLELAMNKVDSAVNLIKNLQTIPKDKLIRSLYIKGRIYEMKGEFTREYKSLNSAIHISNSFKMDTGFIYARCLVHYAISCLNLNKEQLAFTPLIKSIEIFNQIKDKNNVLFASSNLLNYYFQTDQFNEAENKILELEQTVDSTYLLIYLNFFYNYTSNFYWKLNILDKALFYHEKIKQVSESDSCKHLTNKLLYTIGTEETKGIRDLLFQCIECNSKFSQVDIPNYTNSLNVCSEVIISNNIADLALADSLLELEASLLHINDLETDSSAYNNSFDNVVTYYFLKGNMALKKSDFNTLEGIVLQIAKLTNGFTNFKNIKSEQTELFLILAAHYYFIAKDKKLNEILRIYKDSINNNLASALNFMTESQLNQFIQNKLFSKVDIFYELYNSEIMTEDYSRFLYELALYSKGLLFRKSRELNKLMSSSKDSTIIDLKNKLTKVELKISSESKNIILYLERDQIIRKILNTVVSKDTFNFSDIHNRLKANEIAVEFIKYKSKFGSSNTEKYMALVLDSENQFPKVIPLCDEFQLNKTKVELSFIVDSSIKENASLRGFGLTPKKSNNQSEYQLIWEPILKLFPQAKAIYFSTAGALNQRNLSCVQISDSSYMFDKYKMVQLTSTYNLVREAELKPIHANSALLVGGINYGMNPNKLENAGNLEWNFLEGTLTEVNVLNDQMQKKNIHTKLLKDIQANEENLKINLQDAPDIIHIATHGYYEELKDIGNKYEFFKTNPLQHSILVLANANINSNDLEKNNGYLNALEISKMDLSATKLVVLSACESAVGENINQYESNLSLIRGFKIAGAKSIISTLWQVSDKSTIAFMKIFYQFLLNNELDVNEAFIATQKQLRSDNKNDNNWSAFMLVD